MKQCSPVCSKILGVFRIALALGMLYFWLKKLGATPENAAFIWWAAHLMWLTFLSVGVRFWIATIAELLAAILLFSGCKSCTKWWALLTIIVMIFALNTLWWITAQTMVMVSWIFLLIAVALLVRGPGKWRFYSLCKSSQSSCGGCCGTDAQQHQQHQQQQQQ